MTIDSNLTLVSLGIELIILVYFSYSFVRNKNFRIMEYPELFWSLMIILFLSLYQVSELLSCSLGYTRFGNIFGYMIITWFPAFGLYLIKSFDVRTFYIEHVALLGAAGFNLYFLFNSGNIQLLGCLGDYVVVSGGGLDSEMYGFYYSGALIASIGFLGMNIKRGKSLLTSPLFIVIAAFFAVTLPAFLDMDLFSSDGNFIVNLSRQWVLGIVLIIAYFLKVKNTELQKIPAREIQYKYIVY